MTHSLPSSLPAGFWSKAYIITSEEAEGVVKAMLVKRSVKAIAINIPCFFFILTKTFTVLFMLIYPGSTRKIYKECGDCLTHGICREKKYY